MGWLQRLCTYFAEAMHLCCGGYALAFSDSNTTPGYTTLLYSALDCGNIPNKTIQNPLKQEHFSLYIHTRFTLLKQCYKHAKTKILYINKIIQYTQFFFIS